MSLEWRSGASGGLLKLAVGRCLIATMDATKWRELGTITGSREQVQDHPRLLRSLYFGDDDYDTCVWEILPRVLGERAYGDGSETLPNLEVVAEFIDLAAWLANNDEAMFRRIFNVAHNDDTGTVMADGIVLTSVETAAARLDIGEMRRQVGRIRRDFSADPEAVIGASKELVETVCKTILGLTGDADTRDDLPRLVKLTLVHLGLDAASVSQDDGDTTEAHALKRVLGGVSSIFRGADELRNARGTGHGRSGLPLVDESLARLTVGLVIPAVAFLIEVYDQSLAGKESDAVGISSMRQSAAMTTPRIPSGTLRAGHLVRHPSFGEGQVVAIEHGGTEKEIVSVDFAPCAPVKRLLQRVAPLTVIGP